MSVKIICKPDLTSGQVLKFLYENTSQVGMGMFVKDKERSDKEWQEISTKGYIDYMGGRPIKTDFTSYPNLDLSLYSRDSNNIFDIVKHIV